MPTHMQKISIIVEFCLSWHIADLLVRKTFDMHGCVWLHSHEYIESNRCLYVYAY